MQKPYADGVSTYMITLQYIESIAYSRLDSSEWERGGACLIHFVLLYVAGKVWEETIDQKIVADVLIVIIRDM